MSCAQGEIGWIGGGERRICTAQSMGGREKEMFEAVVARDAAKVAGMVAAAPELVECRNEEVRFSLSPLFFLLHLLSFCTH